MRLEIFGLRSEPIDMLAETKKMENSRLETMGRAQFSFPVLEFQR